MFPTPSRRKFMQTAGVAIATAAFPILGANDRINVGIVGLGGRGRDHINHYGQLDADCRIAALCDVNQAARERGIAMVQKTKDYAPKEYEDMRKLFESKDIDAVSLPIPNHWHALATIWACQAGKDVYCEKPACHNIFEGAQMVAAARKYNRMVQIGSQSRSIPYKIKAVKLLQDGVIGQIYHARGCCYKRRFSIGHTPNEPVPPGLDWDKFLGPAQWKPYSKNQFAYNWHWFWDTGNGDVGNQGIHEIDVALWGLGRTSLPKSVTGQGGKYIWQDDQQTPNTLLSTFDFGDALMSFDTRNLPTQPEGLLGIRGANFIGNLFYGEGGFMIVDQGGFQVYKSRAGNVSREQSLGAGAARLEKYELAIDEKADPARVYDTTPHMKNFFDAIRARDYRLLHADVAIGVHSATFPHLTNISYRVGRSLQIAPSTGAVIGDEEANALYTRNYREPYVVPAVV